MTNKKRKEMNRKEFERIKALSLKPKATVKAVATKTGWSDETVRLIFKYATFESYRRKIIAKAKAARAKRQAEKDFFHHDNDAGTFIDSPEELTLSKTAGLDLSSRYKKAMKSAKKFFAGFSKK